MAYPFIPGSGSPAFNGISVIAGLMATLGSAGIVNQFMSGLILLYSRALVRGEIVRIGTAEGMVTGVGLLSTKVQTYRNEEITVPNTVVIGAQITNFSRMAVTQSATVATQVGVGYDQSWRQVSAALLEAARATRGVRTEPPPRVLQLELAPFYVNYELVVAIESPEARFTVLDELLGNVQDQFNRRGMQIMTPAFESQPQRKVYVPREHWFAAPSDLPPDGSGQ